MTETTAPMLKPVPEHLRVGLLPWESEEDFEALFQDYVQTYPPRGPAEASLVEQLVWLDWRRRRLRLGERALHMASLERRSSTSYPDQLSRRALLTKDASRHETPSAVAIRSSDQQDQNSHSENANHLVAAEEARRLIEEQGPDRFEAALNALPEQTQVWFDDLAEEEEERFPRTADGLQSFLTFRAIPFFKSSREGALVGPLIRLQAWGESLDPERADKLLTLDERLMRQYEKALGMLIRLQELGSPRVSG